MNCKSAEKEKCYLSKKDMILKITKDKQNGAINCDDVLRIIAKIKEDL